VPSWVVFGSDDRNIPAELVRFMAERAGAKEAREVAGGSHALSVSDPDAVTATIADALAAL
jgi:pimeloyl-ACP methyl ester carboxylesterase